MAATAASYGHSAGPSARPMTASPTKPVVSSRMPSSRDEKGATASSKISPSKKKITMKKTRLPEVGPTIRDLENNVVHITGKLLGQGGFARVYQVQGPDGKAMAFKAIMKEALLHQRKNRQKVLAEILIHRSLHHPNIVHFIDLFQDEANVYFKLELCSNGSMNDMIRTRGPCSDEEARFYMIQIIAGTKFMHMNHVIHRDLKLGNIFLDSNMNTKIGDFGLAALLKDPEERKKTMCGTPNYIAPEILYEGNGNGHSFEVDIWSVGVILYTLLAGKPPFQTTSVPAIYEKIRKNEYTIPDHVRPEACDLIRSILTPDPSQRPSLVEIMNHPWFTVGKVPLHVPSTATKASPSLILPRTMEESLRNFETLKKLSGWRDDADDEVEEEEMTEEQRRQSAKEKRRAQERAEDDRERMDKEFENAIQPGSSLAGFLQLGKKALSKAPDATGPLRPKSLTGLSRQISALSLSRQQGNSMAANMAIGKGGYEEHPQTALFSGNADKENANSPMDARMMPPPTALSHVRSRGDLASAAAADERRMLNQKARLVAAMTGSGSGGSLASVASGQTRPGSMQTPIVIPDDAKEADDYIELANLDVMVQNLDDAIDAFQERTRFIPNDRASRETKIALAVRPDAMNPNRMRPRSPKAYIICWLDEMDKYGLGYALSDGTIGVYLKDESSIATNANRTHFDHVSRLHDSRGFQARPENFEIPQTGPVGDSMSRDIQRKYKILGYFEDKIDARLEGFDLPLDDRGRTSDMPFIWRWYRCLQAIVFRLSTSTVQFNFYDHIKLLFSNDGLVLTAIVPSKSGDEAQTIRTWTMDEFIDIAEKTRSSREQVDQRLTSPYEKLDDRTEDDYPLAITTPEERKLVRSLVAKVKYARDTMIKIASKDATAITTIGGPTTSSALNSQQNTPILQTKSSIISASAIKSSAARTRAGSTATLPRSNSGQSINSIASSMRRGL
ncbi:hypothetical protein L7F22_043997 [Adiantum nelumboides]|nr:hypothetical protein [Adiantum nelumboides]